MTSGSVGGTDARRADRDPAASRQRFLDMSIDLLAVLGLDATILEVSRSWERTLGWVPEDVVGRSLLDLLHPDDRASIETELVSVPDGQDAVAVVVRVRGRDGSYRWVQGSARSDLDAGRIYVTGADIGERMRLEEALRKQLELEELVAAIASRFIGTDHDQVPAEIERAIGELAQAMGADRAHFLRGTRRSHDRTYVEWLDPTSGPRPHAPAPHPDVQRWWLDRLRSGQLIRIEDLATLEEEAPLVVESLRAEGVQSVVVVPLPLHLRFWGFLALVAIRDNVRFDDRTTALLRLAGECFMTALAQGDDALALLDARRELELRNEELERMNEELERTNEELERFAFAAAHDLKAPLSRIEMALSTASSGGMAAGGARNPLLEVAGRAAARMSQLIEDLVAFAAAGPTAGSMEPVDLDELLTEVLSDLEPMMTAGNVHVERSPLPPVVGRRALLGQLLQNLLANAAKFRRRGVDPVVRVEGRADSEGLTLAVRDNGIGIEPEHRNEVFGVFTRLNAAEVYAGSGIGLATCAKVVNQHHGRIWVEDGIDGGTAVMVWLPAGQPVATS